MGALPVANEFVLRLCLRFIITCLFSNTPWELFAVAYREGYNVIAPGTTGRRTRKKDLNLGLQRDFPPYERCIGWWCLWHHDLNMPAMLGLPMPMPVFCELLLLRVPLST